MKDFRKLKIWQQGIEITKKVYQFTEQLPDKEKFGLVSQMNRSAVSIPSNIAEGCSRSSAVELKRFIEIALGSAFELETQLMISNEIYDIEINDILVPLNHLQKMMNSYHSKLKATPNIKYSQSPTNHQSPITNHQSPTTNN